MGLKVDARGAYRAGKRFKSMASRMDKAEALARSDLQRRLVPEFVRDAQTTHNVKAARVRESSGARISGTAVELTGYDRPTGLLQFGAKAGRSGVTVTITRAEGPTRFKHAFKATGLSGNAQIFERDLKKPKREMAFGRYKGKKRQPIKSLYGPSVAQILRDPARRERLTKFSQKTLGAEIRRQLGRL